MILEIEIDVIIARKGWVKRMEVFGLDVSPENINCLPPKIWRAVMLWIYGLPVTSYIVRDIRMTPAHEIANALLMELQKSSVGIVVRTAALNDEKRAPYFWIKRASDIDSVVAAILQGEQPYLMAFAPKTTPAKASGFVVGRYILEPDGARALEFVSGAIEPRKLEKISAISPEYGLVRKGVGHVFEIVKGGADNYPYQAIVAELLWHEENLSLLKEYVLREKASCYCLCVEFTYWGGYNGLEFHDFDYRNDAVYFSQ